MKKVIVAVVAAFGLVAVPVSAGAGERAPLKQRVVWCVKVSLPAPYGVGVFCGFRWVVVPPSTGMRRHA